MQESVDDRKFWNIMKGIGIICVVVGHSGSWLTPYVYMFHMVLFVFISGYLFNERYVGDFKSFLKKRGKSLYWPTVKYRTLNPQLHSRSATYKRNGLLIRKTAIKSSRPFQCAYYPLTP